MTLMPVTRMAASVDWSTNGRRLGVDRHRHVAADRAALVDRLTDDVHDAAEGLGTDGHADLAAGGGDALAAGQTFGRVHGDRADDVLAKMLGDFEDQAIVAIGRFERGEDRRKLAFERNVDDGADDLRDRADEVAAGRGGGVSSGLLGLGGGAAVAMVFVSSFELYSASAPEMISTSSVVIAAWRWRLYLIDNLLIMSPALRVALSIAVIWTP